VLRIPAIRRGVHRLIEPQVLFPLIAVVLLAGLWATALELTAIRRHDAELSADRTVTELLDTYEAQVLRALRDIDQTLTTVRFWRERSNGRSVLMQLRDNGLLPPDLLFIVSIADREGQIVESTRPLPGRSVADEDYFLEQRDIGTFFIGHLPPGNKSDSTLRFSRRLSTPDGSFAGVVIVAVDADYFVSGYETEKLGSHGLLGLLGTDGVYRVRRSGDDVRIGDVVPYAAVIKESAVAAPGASFTSNSIDGIARWRRARELYGFPVAVVVGLSVAEQMAVAQHDNAVYLWRTALASVVIVLLTTFLGRLSWQLARSRVREAESRVDYARRIEFLAYHDGLTGLPNRSMFAKLLGEYIGAAARDGQELAIVFMDLDRFKQINDTLGHEAGDELLIQVAARLNACVRDTDSVARLGGDEFVVVLQELGDSQYAQTVAKRILVAIAKPFSMQGHEFRVTASLGISRYPLDGRDEQTLTTRADIAMYHAKAKGKNNYKFYSDELDHNPLERLALESSLRQALLRSEFRLLYQAKRDIVSGRVTGMEALLRWQHPELGTVAPMDFIPIAEESGLMVEIGRWVLNEACAQNVAWQKMGLPSVTIAVNLTARQFGDALLVDDVQAALSASGMEAKYLELEIGEGLLIQDVTKTAQVLGALRALGVRIGLGDFGTGYTSLATLQRFPIDTIKIDRSLIRDIGSSDEETALADAIIAMGRSLSLTVVAQGVETESQAEFLRIHACDELQGFYFKRPLPAAEFTKLLQAQAHDTTYIGRRAGLAPVA
jgi:diguanylate cyclase (GGDEF)-like protein